MPEHGESLLGQKQLGGEKHCAAEDIKAALKDTNRDVQFTIIGQHKQGQVLHLNE
jgi:hypothetical protein